MRKPFIVLVLVLAVVGICSAQTVTLLPNASSEITLYDFGTHSLKLGLRYPAFSILDLVFFDGALVTDFDTVGIAGGTSLELTTLAKLLGLRVYLVDNFIFGGCGGYNFSRKKAIYGIYTGIKFKW